MIRTEASVVANDATIPTAKPAPCPAAARAAPAAVPFSSVAPTMIGSAQWRERTLASSRAKPRARAAASVAPLRETPGMSAQACARPRQSASAAPPPRGGAPRRRASAATIASEPATSPAATVAGVPSRCSIGRSRT